jgi:tetratricopeptide (TPR) repeat protein
MAASGFFATYRFPRHESAAPSPLAPGSSSVIHSSRTALCIVLALSVAGVSGGAHARSSHDPDKWKAASGGAGDADTTRMIEAAERLALDPALGPVPPQNPLDERLLADAADGRLDEHTLFRAALVANGACDPRVVREYERRLDAWQAELAAAGVAGLPPREQARAVLSFLHKRVLSGGYHLEASNVAETIETGRYNCVSSSVLFNALAERLGLPVAAVECPAHVFSRLLLAEEALDVETTCPEWFDIVDRLAPGQTALTLPARQGLSSLGSLDVSAIGDRRPIGPLGLVAIVYYNRGVEHIERHAFQDALLANAKALRFDPTSAAARANLLAAVNNWALAESAAGEFARSARILEAGLDMAPEHAMFRVNYVVVHQQWVKHLAARGLHDEALAILVHAAGHLPDEEFFRRAAEEVRRK